MTETKKKDDREAAERQQRGRKNIDRGRKRMTERKYDNREEGKR